MSRPRTAGISNRHALRITTYLHLSTSVSPRVSLPSDCVPRSARRRCQQRGCGPGARGGIPDPAFGDRVHAGRPDVAEHHPDPGIGKDLLECGSEVRSAAADHESDTIRLVAEVHDQVAGLLGGPFPGWMQGDSEDADPPGRVPGHGTLWGSITRSGLAWAVLWVEI